MVWLKKIIKTIMAYLTWPYYRIKDEREFKKRLKELRKRDPFIYK
jgi:hypothetical protein